MTFDARITPFRGDLAALSLRGQVQAARYVAPQTMHVVTAVAPMRAAPAADATQVSEALLGETVHLFDQSGDWAWVQHGGDGYIGYISRSALAEGPPPVPTHQVAVVRAPLFAGPSLKTPTVTVLSLTSHVQVVEEQGRYGRLAGGGWVFMPCLLPIDAPPAAEPLAVALGFLETPYLWGGRSGHGIDCSGLAQIVFARCGVALPRDSDQQQAALSQAWAVSASAPGDLLYFPGHVAMVADEARVLHATAHTMRVCLEPLAALVARAGPPLLTCRPLS